MGFTERARKAWQSRPARPLMCQPGMARDYRKLRVFIEGDALVPLLYVATTSLPVEERFGLQIQLRKAAVSVPTNLAEGSARRSTAGFLRFVEIAFGSAREVGYLIGLCVRLDFMSTAIAAPLIERYETLQAQLNSLLESLSDRNK